MTLAAALSSADTDAGLRTPPGIMAGTTDP
jgi:hypothetical protein